MASSRRSTPLRPGSFDFGIKDVRDYYPLEDHPTLYRLFAELEDAPTAIVDFANKYGAMTAGVGVYDTHGRQPLTLDIDPFLWPNALPPADTDLLVQTFWQWQAEPETRKVWRLQIAAMREIIKAWEVTREGRSAEERQAVRERVAAHLRHRVVPGFDSAGRLLFRPVDLLGALWLQLATAVAGGLLPRQCPRCRTWFEVGRPVFGDPDSRAGRSDKEFCGTPCRMAAAYDRRKESRRAAQTDDG